MKRRIVLRKVANILSYQRRRRKRLYQQWVEKAGLPPEAVPLEVQNSEAVRPEAHKPLSVRLVPAGPVATHPKVTGDMMAEINRRELRLPLLYVFLGASALILCVGLILLIIHSC